MCVGYEGYFVLFLYLFGLILLVSLALKMELVSMKTVTIILGILILLKIITVFINRNSLKLNHSLSYTSNRFLSDPGHLF